MFIHTIIPLSDTFKIKMRLLTVSSLLVIPIHSFIPGGSRQPFQSGSAATYSSAIFYFDDISRRRFPDSSHWTPSILDQIQFASSPCSGSGSDSDSSGNSLSDSYTAEKLVQLQKSLHGYDTASAATLKAIEVQDVIANWMDRVCFDSEFFSSSHTHGCSRSIRVCNGSSVVECMSYIWDCINESQEDVYQKERHPFSPCIDMIIFPYCSDLYKYETMHQISQELSECSEYCNSFGKEYVVSAFHPNFNFEPRMLSPVRHTPFPCFGLHRPDRSQDSVPYADETVNDTDGSANVPVDPEISSMFDDMEIMARERSNLEDIFSLEAAPGFKKNTNYDEMAKSVSELGNDSSYYIDKTQDWMARECNYNNPALKHSSSIGDRWRVESSMTAEAIYREAWKSILDVKMSAREGNASTSASAMFIATKFSLYNAQRFKKIALTINKSLKNSKADVAMELFHPDFVGQSNASSKFRRSPFPSLQFTINHNADT